MRKLLPWIACQSALFGFFLWFRSDDPSGTFIATLILTGLLALFFAWGRQGIAWVKRSRGSLMGKLLWGGFQFGIVLILFTIAAVIVGPHKLPRIVIVVFIFAAILAAYLATRALNSVINRRSVAFRKVSTLRDSVSHGRSTNASKAHKQRLRSLHS